MCCRTGQLSQLCAPDRGVVDGRRRALLMGLLLRLWRSAGSSDHTEQQVNRSRFLAVPLLPPDKTISRRQEAFCLLFRDKVEPLKPDTVQILKMDWSCMFKSRIISRVFLSEIPFAFFSSDSPHQWSSARCSVSLVVVLCIFLSITESTTLFRDPILYTQYLNFWIPEVEHS